METEIKKKNFNFKNYYDNNPEFKQRHLANMRQVIECECGQHTTKVNLSKHKRSKKHLKAMIHVETPTVQDKIQLLEKQLNILKNEINENK